MTVTKIFPKPEYTEILQGTIRMPASVRFNIDSVLLSLCSEKGYEIKKEIQKFFQFQKNGFKFEIKYEKLHPEMYKLKVTEEGISLTAGDSAGIYYGMGTFRQIVSWNEGVLPCIIVEDKPKMALRGVLLDIGRDKIPKLETLFELIDKFANMRFNHLELYMEGYTFLWKGYEHLFPDETPLTQEDLRALCAYAKARQIDLVPNVNILGHMEKWLAKPQLRPLAECEEGYLFQNLFRREPMTIDVRDETAKSFVFDLLMQLMDCFDSEYVNVNLDEPFELGMGKNAGFVEEHGKAKLYMDYVSEVHQKLKEKGKKMILWGDVLFTHPECIKSLPDDSLLLDWMYEGKGDFAPHAKELQKEGRQFGLCPGTSCWCSHTGRTDNMIQNIKNAAENVIEYGGKGMILTDWGDLGHWQYISASYPAFVHGAFYGWCGLTDDAGVMEQFANEYLYQDKQNKAFKLALDLGNYYKLEKAPLYSTTLCAAVLTSKYKFSTVEEFHDRIRLMLKLSNNLAQGMNIPEEEQVIALDQIELMNALTLLEERVEQSDFAGNDGKRIKNEMRHSLRFVKHGLHLYQTMMEDYKDNQKFNAEMKHLYIDLKDMISIHYKLWMERNRRGGFSRSVSQLEHLLHVYHMLSKNN